MRTTTLAPLALAVTLGACATSRERERETAAAATVISGQEENQIGRRIKAQLELEQRVRYLQDPAVTRYVDDVASRVLANARRERPGLEWQVFVVDDASRATAFGAPGGGIYVYSGLLLQTDDEAELAGVIAHEAGHEVARHWLRRMLGEHGIRDVTALALGENPALASSIAGRIGERGQLVAHDQREELEADEYAVRYASGAGYDPRALLLFVEKLRAREPQTPAVAAYLSDHPTTTDRIQQANTYIAEHQLVGGERGQERMARAIKSRLQASISAPATF